jgi:hypothetical protein
MRQPAIRSSDAPSVFYLAVLALLAGVFLAVGFLVTGAGAMFDAALHPPTDEPTSTTSTSTTSTPPPVTEPLDPAEIGAVEGGPDEVPAD